MFAGSDLDRDNCGELVIGAGQDPNVGPLVKIFNDDEESVRLWLSPGSSPTEWTPWRQRCGRVVLIHKEVSDHFRAPPRSPDPERMFFMLEKMGL